MAHSETETRNEIRARYDERTIRVYQAFRPEIAHAALSAGRFVAPFRMNRMTWIKPSFNWMMHRCRFGSAEGQEVVLAIDILREGFEWALQHAALSSYPAQPGYSHTEWKEDLKRMPVRIQWDPERDWRQRIVRDRRAIQVGLGNQAVELYVNEWVMKIEDVTPAARLAAFDVRAESRPSIHPSTLEQVYPAPAGLERIGLSI